jgi:drug/metabolite transporter (DMT)-like permease
MGPRQVRFFPFVFALLWASSYAAAKIGLLDITPCAFVTVRLAIAAAAAVLFVMALGRPWTPIAHAWPHLLLGGALAHGLALSTTHAALVTVAATPAALVHAFHPVLTAALGVLLLGDRFAWWQWLGVALGFAGVLLGVPFRSGSGALTLLALSLFGLTAGTLYLKYSCPQVPAFEATAVQLIGGALLSFAATLLFETPHVRWTASLAGAMAWNIVAMSILGMAIYNAMLDRAGAGKAASGFFIVPGASALVAWSLLNERFSFLAVGGLVASTLGVALVWWRPRAQR